MTNVRHLLIVTLKPPCRVPFQAALRVQEYFADLLRADWATLSNPERGFQGSQNLLRLNVVGMMLVLEHFPPVVTLGRRSLVDEELSQPLEVLENQGVQVLFIGS